MTILSGRINKESSPGKFYMSNVENKMYFNKDLIFLITDRENIDGKSFYWVKNTKTEKKNKK